MDDNNQEVDMGRLANQIEDSDAEAISNIEIKSPKTSRKERELQKQKLFDYLATNGLK